MARRCAAKPGLHVTSRNSCFCRIRRARLGPKRGQIRCELEPTIVSQAAIRDCGASRCRVVSTLGPNMCGALATTEDGKHAGAAKRKDSAAARLAALKNCEKNKAGACIVRAANCNK